VCGAITVTARGYDDYSTRNEINNYIIIIHTFIMRTHSVMMLNQRHWQSLGGQHGKGVEKVSFQTAFEGVESGGSLILRGRPFQTVGAK